MRVSNLVEKALQTWPQTRDSDKKLILSVWWLQDNEYEQHFKEFFLDKAYTPESITRCRRKLQEQGLYPASKEIENSRYNKFKDMRYTKGSINVIDHNF